MVIYREHHGHLEVMVCSNEADSPLPLMKQNLRIGARADIVEQARKSFGVEAIVHARPLGGYRRPSMEYTSVFAVEAKRQLFTPPGIDWQGFDVLLGKLTGPIAAAVATLPERLEKIKPRTSPWLRRYVEA